MRSYLGLVMALAVFGARAGAVEIGVGAGFGASTETPNVVWPTLSGSVSHETDQFRFWWDLEASGEGYYGGLFGGQFYGGLSVFTKEGGMSWRTGGLFVEGGKLALEDELDSPYSLFLSGRKNAAVGARVRYEDERFFFSDRWIALNYDSEYSWDTTDWPDRSAVLKTYGMKLGKLRFGFQDAVVYTADASRGPAFEAEYFLNPAPSFFVQYIRSAEDGPWSADSSAGNDNSILGFFGEWTEERWSARAQILVDDINMNRFFAPDDYQNPDKIAATVGATFRTDAGEFTADIAGATKYCFEPYGDDQGTDNTYYGYTFYPDLLYTVDGEDRYLTVEQASLGYLHGENNLALRGAWGRSFGRLDAAAAIELTISGSKSPTNPWHEYAVWSDDGQGTKWLDDAVLEKRLVVDGAVSYPFGDLRLGAQFELGYVWNALAPTAADPTDPANGMTIWKPSDEDAVIASIYIGATYTLR